jgi:hypothetical protein
LSGIKLSPSEQVATTEPGSIPGTHACLGKQTPFNGAIMISDNCSIEEFVETVKDKQSWEVVALAVDEATWAERMFYRPHQTLVSDKDLFCIQQYLRQLKQLINYLRFEVNPRRPKEKAYQLYMMHWDNENQENMNVLTD